MRTAAPRGGRLLPAAAGGLALFAFAAMGLMIAAAAAYVLLANTQPRGLFLLYACVPALCLAGAAALLPAERLGRRAFLILLFTAALVLKGAVALTVTPRLESDFYLLHYAAEQLAQGNNILNDTSYFQLWPYQSFFVAVLAGVMKLFGSSPAVFRLMNVLLSALTNLLVYALARRFASERGARLAGLLFLLYPGTFFLIPLLTNQHLSECLLLAAFWACTAPAERLSGRLWRGGAGGVLLALSNAVRPMGLVAVLALCACMVFQLMEVWEKRSGWTALLPGLCTLAAYFLCGALISGLVVWTGLNRLGLTNQAPEWKFVLGLNTQSLGRYSDADAAAVFGPGVADWRGELERLLEERLTISLPALLRLMAHKIRIMWGGFEDASWVLTASYLAELEGRGLAAAALTGTGVLQRLCSGCWISMNLMNAGAALSALRRRERPRGVRLLLMLTALAYFCAHLLIEIQIRYRSTMTLLLFVLAAAGFDWVAGLVRRKGSVETE